MGKRGGGYRKKRKVRVQVRTNHENSEPCSQKFDTFSPVKRHFLKSLANRHNVESGEDCLNIQRNPVSMLNKFLKRGGFKEKSSVASCKPLVQYEKSGSSYVRVTAFDRVLQFYITLQDIKPPIWRRIQIPADCSFWDLHVAIQDAMGWEDCHAHKFHIKDPCTGEIRTFISDFTEELVNNSELLISHEIENRLINFFNMDNTTGTYEYDFTSPWVHQVYLEGIREVDPNVNYPNCIGGARACPIEDCGGIWGYNEIVKYLQSPRNQRANFEDHILWVLKRKKNYDSELFDSNSVIFRDPGMYLDHYFTSCVDDFFNKSELEDSDKEDHLYCKIFEDEAVDHLVPMNNKSGRLPSSLQIYQFMISLRGSDPKISRTILVPGHCTFWEFHIAIQDAFRWSDQQMHFFEINHPLTKKSHLIFLDEDENMWDLKKTKIAEEYVRICDYFTRWNRLASYCYDYTSYWEHKIFFEKTVPIVPGEVYPRCVAAEGPCLPENCGGVWKYQNYLKLSKDPNNAEYKELSKMMAPILNNGNNPTSNTVPPHLIMFGDPKACYAYRYASDGDSSDVYLTENRFGIHGSLIPRPPGIFQFKITISGSNPRIWRRIQVPATFTFWKLAVVILDVMDWDGAGMHRFDVINPKSHLEEVLMVKEYYFPKVNSMQFVSEQNAPLLDYFDILNRFCWFEFNCYALWRHKIVFEKFICTEKNISEPICLDGRRAGPLILCSGIHDYENLVSIIKNPSHELYEKKINWLNAHDKFPFNPDTFDPEAVKFSDPEKVWLQTIVRLSKLMEVGKEETVVKTKSSVQYVLQFKIVVKGLDISRFIQIPGNYTFWDFHVAIQDAVGWNDSSLHQFEISELSKKLIVVTLNEFSNIDPRLKINPKECWERRIPEAETKVITYFSEPGAEGVYEYDFVEQWEHEFRLEGVLTPEEGVQYPRCIGGEGACPIQNSGGVRGYKEILIILGNPSHPSYSVIRQWVENVRGKFDPLEFNVENVVFTDPKIRWTSRNCTNKSVKK